MTKKLTLVESSGFETMDQITVTLPIQDLGQCTFEVRIKQDPDEISPVLLVQCYFKPNSLDIIDGEVITKSLQVLGKYIFDNFNEYKLAETSLFNFFIGLGTNKKLINMYIFLPQSAINTLRNGGLTPIDYLEYDIHAQILEGLRYVKFDPNFENLYKVKEKKLNNIIRVLQEGKVINPRNSFEYHYKLTNIESNVLHDSSHYIINNRVIEPDFETIVVAKMVIDDLINIPESVVNAIIIRFQNIGIDNVQIMR